MSVQAAARGEEPKDHGLVAEQVRKSVTEGVIYEKRPVKGADGKPVAGLYNAWITLNNPTQFNSYTTEMVKSVILAFLHFCGNHVHPHFFVNSRDCDQQRPFFEQWHEFGKHVFFPP